MKLIFILGLMLLSIPTFSQLGGNHVYEFLTIPVSARAGALGGSAIAINDGDLSLANENPSLFSPSTSNKLTFDYINYMADINMAYTSYSHYIDNIGSFGIGLRHLSGGEFTQTDDSGNKYGDFHVSETALNLSYARQFDSAFAIGATVKPIYSQLENYNSFGLAMDVGFHYSSRNKLITAALVLKNMGSQLSTYNDEYEPVPFEIQAGFSTKLEHAPFRFSVIAQQLQTPDLTYVQTNYVNDYNKEQEPVETKAAEWTDKVMRHMIFGVEFLPTKSFFLRGGLNMQRRQELKLTDKPGMAGFTWGFGFRISKLHFSYANARYNNAGISNHFSITTNLNDFFKN